jgi:hypothetical protein
MKTYFLSLGFFLITLTASSQNFKDPDSILVENKKLPKILLVGTWHFNYPGLDSYKVDEKDKINIYSAKRQKELTELIDYISRFKPTKIVVESGMITGYLIKNYERYKRGEQELYAAERSQIGMRLVERFKLDTIYGADAYPLILELNDQRDSLAPKTYIDSILDRHYFGGKDEISKRYTEFYDYETQMTVKKTLLENFLYLNSDKVLDRKFGAYISGGQFDSKHFEGPDALSMYWINRNLRIYKNIRDIGFKEDDRILVIFGSGHIPLLKFFFKCSPLFEVVDFGSLKE